MSTTATTTKTLTLANPPSRNRKVKKVVGLKRTPELLAIAESIIALPSPSSKTSLPPATPSEGGCDNSFSSDSDWTPLKKHQQPTVLGDASGPSASSRNSLDEARDAVRDALSWGEKLTPPVVPLTGVRAMRDVLTQCGCFEGGTADISVMAVKEEFEMAVLTVSQDDGLIYAVEVQKDTRTSEEVKEAEKFRRRMDRLRMQAEENKYQRLTNNLEKEMPGDDANTKSMTFAASVGLNMIITPISFGAFVYFFCGKLIFKDIEVDNESDGGPSQHAVNIRAGIETKRIITGVVAGVALLFIEMILFVIRTHELDESVRKKSKKNKKSPFGRRS